MFGGARGGGKTDALLAYAIKRSLEHPGSNRLFIRKTFSQLTGVGAAIPRSHQFLHGKAHWSEQNYKWTFKNGSVLKFGHLSDVQAIHNYLGSQADDILIDQAEGISYDEYTQLKGANRATVDGIVPTMRLTANPGGIGHGWLKALFIDGMLPNTATDINLGTEERPVWIAHRFVPSRVFDNAELLKRDPNYVQNLRSIGGTLARAWIEGEWDQFSGQFFTEWEPAQHICQPFAVPADWPRWHATDWGLKDPSCTLWGTRSPLGRIYIYRERYEAEKTIDQQALKIRLWSGAEKFRNRVLDPSCWARESNGRSKADQYAAAGVPMAKATNDRTAGWSKLRELLAWTPESPPQLQVFPSCANLIRTLPNMIHSQAEPEDMHKAHGFNGDHAVDTLRYLAMSMDVQRDKRLVSKQPYEMGSRATARQENRQNYVMRKKTLV